MGNSLRCPGFRFSPTDVELVMYHLKKKLLGKKVVLEVIAEVNIYDFSPGDLPAKSVLRNGDLEWFFFCSKSKKYSSGSRTNRATEAGYWKATGKDREVKYKGKTVAMIKTFVFHLGRLSKGERTDWVMHEYRMEDKDLADAGVVQDAYVLCKLFKKSGAGPKIGAQYGAPYEEEERDDDDVDCSQPLAVVDLAGATVTVNLNRSSSAVTNVTLTEVCPSPVTFSGVVGYSVATEPLNPNPSCPPTIMSYEYERRSETSNVTSTGVVGLSATTEPLNDNASGSALKNVTSVEQGPSTITASEYERRVDDTVLTHEDIASMLSNKNTQEVEDRKGKKVMTASPNRDDGFFDNLDFAARNNIDDWYQDAFNMFEVDGSADFIFADDLDIDLDIDL